LTDLCVAVWEAGGSKSSDAAWVMDVSVLQKMKAAESHSGRFFGGRPD
jgi:hypothetical protein